MKLSYKDGKTIVEVDGKQMRVAEAVLKYPTLAKEIIGYSKKAKSLSQIKITSFERVVTKPNYDGRWGDEVSFLINGKLVDLQQSSDAEKIVAPEKISDPELKAKLKEIGKIDWVNGTNLANGKPLTKANYEFIQSYLNGAELNAESGKITTAVEPSFNRNDLNQENSYPYGFIVGEDIKLVQDYYLDFADRHGEAWTDVKFSVTGKNISYTTTTELHFDNGQSAEWEEKGNIAEILKSAGVDIVSAKVGAIKSDYTNQKTKDAELSL